MTFSSLFQARRGLAALLVASLGLTGLAAPAQAAMIGAETLAQTAPAHAPLSAQGRLLAALDREDLRAALIERGVDPAQARARVAALSDVQAEALLAELDQAPAGAGIIDTVVFIFLVLLVTDILGFTKVFPFTRSIR